MPFTHEDIVVLVKSLGVKETANHLFNSPECTPNSVKSVMAKVSALHKKNATLARLARRPSSKATLAAFLKEQFVFPIANPDHHAT